MGTPNLPLSTTSSKEKLNEHNKIFRVCLSLFTITINSSSSKNGLDGYRKRCDSFYLRQQCLVQCPCLGPDGLVGTSRQWGGEFVRKNGLKQY